MKTVQEFIDELDNYGGHLPVVWENREGTRRYEISVDDQNFAGEPHVIIGPIGEPLDLPWSPA